MHVRALANLDGEEAERACTEAISRYPFSTELHYLRAVLLLSLGRMGDAANAARRVIYLDRTLALAHFLLGSILQQQGDRSGAWRAYRNARDLASQQPPGDVVPLAEGETAGRLAEQAAGQMAAAGHRRGDAIMKQRRPRTASPIDWQRVHERLERAAAAASNASENSPERIKAVLDERARVLARVALQPPGASEVIEVATFTLADECFALETRFVRRIVLRWDCTPVPGTPDFLLGITNLHGDVLALYDLSALFGIARGPRIALELRLRSWVLGTNRDELGVIADSVREVRSLRIVDVLEPPGTLDGLARPYLLGVTEDALIVVDGSVLLGDERLIIEQAQGEEPGT